MKSTPELSLILPVYKMERYIVRCLESIYANQGARDRIEVVLVDDGSPDHSIDIATKWEHDKGIGNIKIIRQENKGLGGARNAGLNAASAPFVWMIDPDDVITADALPYILERLNSSCDFLIFNFTFEPDGRVGYPFREEMPSIPASELTSRITVNSPCFNIFNIDFLNKNGLRFKEHFYHEDNEFAIRANFRAKTIACYPKVVYRYFIDTPGSITHRYSEQRINDLLTHFDTYRKLCLESPSHEQLMAMHRINFGVGIHWLLIAAIKADKPIRKYTQDLIIKNRRMLLSAMSAYPLRTRLKTRMKMSRIYFRFKHKQL